jgi:formylglycine-generating enzyme required for sulfatase activity
VSRKELFISYSHKDRAFLEQFWIHLNPLEEDYGLQRWDDTRIQPGDIWLDEIQQALNRAQVALLLFSPDFLASDFIRRKELPALFEAAEKDGLKILWLPIRPCSWKLHRQIEQYQPVGSLDPTLAEMDEVKRDREMVSITNHIHVLFERIQKERLATQQVAESEALARQQEDERRTAAQEAERQAEETTRLERLAGINEARAEAERWQAEAQSLEREMEELKRQATSKTPHRNTQPGALESKGLPLIQIPTTRGWLAREGNAWRRKEEAIMVKGYREELADGISISMIHIPGGEFLMGSPAAEADREDHERPQHQVKLRSFFLGQTPVTQAQWEVVACWPKQGIDLKQKPSRFRGGNRPVEQVSWEEAIEFCRRLSDRKQLIYTLPDEAQWEYACRATKTTPYAYGETLSPDLANYDSSSAYSFGPMGTFRQETNEVGIFPANTWGLQDMHGNVWEWCLDVLHDYPSEILGKGQQQRRFESQDHRILRGGSWFNIPSLCRSASRRYMHAWGLSYNIGFRLCANHWNIYS